MVFGLVRLAVVLFVALTVVYVSVSLYSRSVRRERLERKWAEKAGATGDREEFVRRGLRRYDRSVRRRLILLVYVIPVCVIGIIIYAVNYA